jgi:hypothetical protein
MTHRVAVSSLVLRPIDVADRWQCSEAHVRNLHKRGLLRGFRPGRMLRFTLAEVEAYETGGNAPAPMTALERWKARRGQDQSQRRA